MIMSLFSSLILSGSLLCHLRVLLYRYVNPVTCPNALLYVIGAITLQGSCYVLQSSLLTETQWIYGNFIVLLAEKLNRVTYQYCVRSWQTRNTSQLWTSLAFRAGISPITFSVYMQTSLTRTSLHIDNRSLWSYELITSFMSLFQKSSFRAWQHIDLNNATVNICSLVSCLTTHSSSRC